MKKLSIYITLFLLVLAGCISDDDVDPNFYMVTTRGEKTTSTDDANTDYYTLSFITNNSKVVSGYVSGPGIADTSMIKYNYADGIWTDADGNDKVFQQWMNKDGYRDIWEAFVDIGSEVPVLNRKYSMNLTLEGDKSKKKTVFIRGYCEYAPEILYPENGMVNVNPVPEFSWDPPSYVTTIYQNGLEIPVTEYVYARGYLINIYDSTDSIIWTLRQYDAEATNAVFNSDSNAFSSLESGQDYRLELRFIDFGFNTSSDEITFTVE